MLDKILIGIKGIFLRVKARFDKVDSKRKRWIVRGVKGALAVAALASFAWILNWKSSFVLVGLILVHEYGHLWAAKRNKVSTKGLYFLPFLGCITIITEMPSSRATEAYFSIMGPVWGTALTLVLAVLYPITGQPIFAAIALVNAGFNLFNVLPICVLDGGRVFKAITFSINKWLGMAVMALGLVGAYLLVVNFLNNWIGWLILLYLAVVGLRELRYEYQNRNTSLQTRMSVKQMFSYGFANLGLFAILLAVTIVFVFDEAVLSALMNLVQ